MSSQACSSSSSPEALLPIDDRVIIVSASEESSGPESVNMPKEVPTNVTLCSSEDESTLCLNLLSDPMIGKWG